MLSMASAVASTSASAHLERARHYAAAGRNSCAPTRASPCDRGCVLGNASGNATVIYPRDHALRHSGSHRSAKRTLGPVRALPADVLADVPPAAVATAAAVAASSLGGSVWEGGNVEPLEGGSGAGESAPKKGRGFVVGIPPIFLLVPFFTRATYKYEVVPGRIWTLEQKQGIGLGLNVAVNVRMTVVKMQDGGLWVYGPIAPTEECVALLKSIPSDKGITHIVLPTTLFEHKQFVAPFQRAFPKAKLWVSKGQWTWPVNLPPQLVGIFPTGVLDDANPPAEWNGEFKLATLDPAPVGLSSSIAFNEVAALHVPSRTLLVTDAVVRVSDAVPDVISKRDLDESGDDGNLTISVLKLLGLFDIEKKAAAREAAGAGSEFLTPSEKATLGWRRNVLTALYFGLSDLLQPDDAWEATADRLLVPPVVAAFVYDNVPDDVEAWSDTISKWDFVRIIPAHLDGPIAARPRDWRNAFSAVREAADAKRRDNADTEAASSRTAAAGKDGWAAAFVEGLGRLGSGVGSGAGFGKGSGQRPYYPPADMELLRGVAGFLVDAGIIFTDENRPARRKN